VVIRSLNDIHYSAERRWIRLKIEPLERPIEPASAVLKGQ
jgi:hypothetical protein